MQGEGIEPGKVSLEKSEFGSSSPGVSAEFIGQETAALFVVPHGVEIEQFPQTPA